jgi:hypothetical protein
MDHNLAGIRTGRLLGARAPGRRPRPGPGPAWTGTGSRAAACGMILRSPLGTELARLDSAAARGPGLSGSTRLAPAADRCWIPPCWGSCCPASWRSRGRRGAAALGRPSPRPGGHASEPRPLDTGKTAPRHGGTTSAAVIPCGSVDPATALCDRLEWPGHPGWTLERFQRVGGRWQPRLLRLAETRHGGRRSTPQFRGGGVPGTGPAALIRNQ